MLHLSLVNVLLAIAGAGCLTASFVHSTLGGRLFVAPIVERMDWTGGPMSPRFARQVVWLAWHATSVAWAGFAVILVAPLFGLDQVRTAYWAAFATFAVCLVMTGPGTRWQHRGWPVFALITVSLVAALVAAR